MKREISKPLKLAISAVVGLLDVAVVGVIICFVYPLSRGVAGIIMMNLFALLYLLFIYRKLSFLLDFKGEAFWLGNAFFPSLTTVLYFIVNDGDMSLLLLIYVCPPIWAFALLSGFYELLDRFIPNKKENEK